MILKKMGKKSPEIQVTEPLKVQQPLVNIQKRVAVLIGLNHVDPDQYDGWDGELSGPATDIANMYEQFLSSHLYEHIFIIKDDEATKANIIQKRNEILKLYGNTEGVLLDVYHSHHGGQYFNPKDNDKDKKTETYCFYDGQMPDDVYRKMWETLGKNFLIRVISDTCHSGGYSKLFTPDSRPILDEMGLSVKTVIKAMPIEYAANSAKNALITLPPSVQKGKGKANMMFIAACAEGESSQDLGGEKGGFFTYTFLKGLEMSNTLGDALAESIRQTKGIQSPNIKFNTPLAATAFGDYEKNTFFI